MEIPGLEIDVDALGVPWKSTRHAGVFWMPLHPSGRGADDAADATVLIRMDPGRGYPAHEHVGIEEVLVLSGGYRDESGVHRAGSYLRYPAGSRHAPIALGDQEQPVGEENPSCILFAVARGGVVPTDTQPS